MSIPHLHIETQAMACLVFAVVLHMVAFLASYFASVTKIASNQKVHF